MQQRTPSALLPPFDITKMSGFPTNFSKIYSYNNHLYNMKYDFPSITIIKNIDGKLTTNDVFLHKYFSIFTDS
jgi:hypothetical protein